MDSGKTAASPIAQKRQAMAGKVTGGLVVTTYLCGTALLGGCTQIEWVTDKIGITRAEATQPQVEVSSAAVQPAPRRPLGHDLETPEAFQITAPAIWDGRPTFGEIWIAVPEAIQPERVVIRNERTGTSIRGGMFAGRPGQSNGPIQLSSGAAAALGIEMDDPVTLTVTALRRNANDIDVDAPEAPNGVTDAPSIQLARSANQTINVGLSIDAPIEVSEAPREVATSPPALYPAAAVDDGYLEVAQATTSDSANRVLAELIDAEIPAEIQEDFVDGQAYYRVFARREGEQPELLLSALSNIQFTAEAEGSDDGTVVAEIPVVSTHPEPEGVGAAWVEFGAYPSRNEALAVTQRLSRRGIPSEICEGRQGLLAIHRVFAGPANEDVTPIELASFCAGVAAAEAARPAPEIREAMAPARLTPLPSNQPLGEADAGPVRIKVGEATGELRLVSPERISPPHEISVEGVSVMVPASTPPELLARIREALGEVETVR